MTAYTLLDPQPAARDADTLARYTRDVAANDSLAWPCPWDTTAPGLYPDEQAYQLDTGELVAISVEQHAAGNDVGFHAYARLIEADGSTKTLNGKEMEVSWSVSLTVADVISYTAAAVKLDCAKKLIGEPTTLEREAGVPLIDLGAESELCASIRVHIEAIGQLDQEPVVGL